MWHRAACVRSSGTKDEGRFFEDDFEEIYKRTFTCEVDGTSYTFKFIEDEDAVDEPSVIISYEI